MNILDSIQIKNNALNQLRNQQANEIGSLGRQTKAGPDESEDTKKACQEFESLLVYQMLKVMRSTVPKDGLVSGGKAEEMYAGMLDEELSRMLSRDKGIGLSDMLFRQLNQLQEKKMQNKLKLALQFADIQIRESMMSVKRYIFF